MFTIWNVLKILDRLEIRVSFSVNGEDNKKLPTY